MAYHGRASSVVVSPAAVPRPAGQLPPGVGGEPGHGPCRELDFELEVGAFIGGPANPRGSPVPIAAARDRIFGLVLLNDWSARDIQRWEMVPLGPFNGKNFCTTVSPWVVPLAALAPWATPAPAQHPPVLPYLAQPELDRLTYDVALEVAVVPAGGGGAEAVVCRSNLKHL